MNIFNDEFGRYGIASQKIDGGDVLIDENPFVYGPKANTQIVCLSCCCAVDNESSECQCPNCKWPLCKECWNSNIHSPECCVFTGANVRFFAGIDSKGHCPQLDCITPLRILLKKESDPERWERDVEPMEYHDAARKDSKETWHADLINVAKYLRGPCKLSRFSEELIMKVIGILQVNAFEAKTPQGYPLRCLFPQTAILAHNCTPNTIRTIYPSDGYRIKVRALVDIKKEDILFVSYTYILEGTVERQQHLRDAKYFICRCKRCSDPTELGTHFSSLKCQQCESGYLVAYDPFDKLSEWKCDQCEWLLPPYDIEQILDPIQTEVNNMEALPYNESRIEYTEQLYRKYHKILHPLHFIQTNLRQSLIQMYGRMKGYELTSLPDYMLEYKVELCNLVLKVLDIFEPGQSRSRAAVLYELHGPLALLAQRSHASGFMSAPEFRVQMKEAILTLQEAVDIFEREDPCSLEGSLAKVGQTGLEQLREMIKGL